MRGMLCVCVLLGVVAVALPVQEKPRPELESLVAAERAFAKMSVEKGMKAAFLENLADDAVVFRPRVVNGRKFYEALPESTAVLEWEPTFADVSLAGDLGYTTGPWNLRPKPGTAPTRFGHYVSIWKRQPDSKWKVVLDVGVPYNQTPEVKTQVEYAIPAPPFPAPRAGERDSFPDDGLRFALLQMQSNWFGIPAQFKLQFSPELRLYRENHGPKRGNDAVDSLKDEQPTTIGYKVLDEQKAASLDLGYWYGYLHPEGAAAPSASFLRIWKRDGAGQPRIVLDLANRISRQQNHPFLDLRESRSVLRDGRGTFGMMTKGSVWVPAGSDLAWESQRTALIVCDVWDKHWCPNAVTRLNAMIPRMEKVVEEARKKGVLIIHAPSECMKFYEGTPQRKLAKDAPKAANLPKDIDKWCSRLKDEPKLPIDDSDNGCDGEPGAKPHQAWTRQHPGIRIADGDAVSDSGVEIWNLLQQRGIKNVMVMGVHTNMCVLGRPFGLRQLAKNGMKVVLVRDLTDTMYNPKMPPHVSHEKGTELVIEHIERHVCGTIHSRDILGEPLNPHVVFIIGENEYQTEKTLPEFAKRELQPLGLRCTFVLADTKNHNEFPGLEAIKTADLVFLSVRRRALSEKQLALIRQYLEEGKPLIGIRTASHAFDPKPPDQGASWPTFDVDVLGAKYLGHYANKPPQQKVTIIQVVSEHAKHPILTGINTVPFQAGTHLYKYRDLSKSATPLLQGTITGESVQEPVAWTHSYKGGRIFYTSLGGPGDFELPVVRRLLKNAVLWALDRPIVP